MAFELATQNMSGTEQTGNEGSSKWHERSWRMLAVTGVTSSLS